MNSNESSLGSVPKAYDVKRVGNLKNLYINCYEKRNCSVFNILSLNFTWNNALIDYEIKKLSAKTIKKEHSTTKDSINFEKAIGSIVLSPEIQVKLNTDPLFSDFLLEDFDYIISAVNELKSFYFRMTRPQIKITSDIFSSISINEKKRINKDQAIIIEELKQHTSTLAVELEEKIQECNLLRKTLYEVAGNSGIAGILNINTKEIISISENGQIEGIDVSLVLTKDIIYVIGKEGRVLNKDFIVDMVALEEKGSNELLIKMKEGKLIRSTLQNKNEFVRAIKEIFQIECT